MSPAEHDLTVARAARDNARLVFDTRLAQVRGDLSARGVGGRVADRLGEDAREVFGDAIDVAAESKGIIAGTIAVIALWLLRQPIIAWVAGMLHHDEDTGETKEEHR